MKIKDIKSALKQIKNPSPNREFLTLLRKNIKMQMKAFPIDVRNDKLERLNTKQRSQSLLINKFKTKTMIPAIISLIVIFSGGGAAAASQNSLPGDALYPVKTLTEDVRLAITINEKSKASLNIELAQRRVEEIRKVLETIQTGQNGSKDQIIQKVLDNFNSHLEKALVNADNLKKESKLADALEAIGELKISSEAYKKILENEGSKITRKELKDKIKEAIVAAKTTDDEAEAKNKEVKDEEDRGINQNSAAGKIKAAENKIAEVEKFLVLKNGPATSTVATTATSTTATSTVVSVDQLGEAKAKLQEAKDAFAAGDYKKAFESARESMKKANEAKHENRLKKLEVKDDENGDVEDDNDRDTNATSTDNDDDNDKATSTRKSDNGKSNGKNERKGGDD